MHASCALVRSLSLSLFLSLHMYVPTYICVSICIYMCIYMNIYTYDYHTTSAYYVCWICSLSCLCHRCPLPLPCERSMCLTGTGILTAEKWWRRRKHVHLKSPRDQTGIRPLPRTSSACSRQKRPLARRRMRCECVCVCVCVCVSPAMLTPHEHAPRWCPCSSVRTLAQLRTVFQILFTCACHVHVCVE